ncbi:tRNA wybutosine-synthesizing protein 4 isoform X3 [Chiloscyllium plagiosum]|uniref:tRNA wybutosine-synthesizing protein 4 isoform X3 n=1 Tax=Chiloscyllium plagiosum TaxID=36176 RepID=UPI001CB8822D|nr:tRNA wybutosine-synthesizing protein 4 isoform X3 [Chiloscyllium plagiosum]
MRNCVVLACGALRMRSCVVPAYRALRKRRGLSVPVAGRMMIMEEEGGVENLAFSARNKRCRNKKQAGKDVAVQGTNDSSIVSKCSMASLGYFNDCFLKGFVNKTTRRAPLINRGYYVRAKAVDYSLHRFLQHTASYSQRQILSLGAGFDSLYFRLKASGELKNVIVYEVDFPDVVQRKATLIKNKQEFMELIGCMNEIKPAWMDNLYLCGLDYKLLGIDLTEIAELDNLLMETGLNPAYPTLLLSEVVLTYMKDASSSAVIHWAANRFSSAVFVVYEQIRPDDPFGQVMQQHFKQLNSTLHALTQFPGKEAQRKRFLNEEWHLKCSHYLILSASKGDLKTCLFFHSLPDFHPNKLDTYDPRQISVFPCEIETENPLFKRFAHCSSLIAPNVVLISGGFGSRVSQHGRLRDAMLMVKSGPVWKCSSVNNVGSIHLLTERMFHSMTSFCDSRCVIFGGRTSPLKPVTSILLLKSEVGDSTISSINLSVKEVECIGTAPTPRWRHTGTEVIYKGQRYLFIYGGRSPKDLVLNDWHFLNLEDYSWSDIPVLGPTPESRHSHSACSWRGGVLIAGGLGATQIPLASVFHLRPMQSGFFWDRIQVTDSFIPRYSHTAHILGDKLFLLGGVTIYTDSIPEVTVIDLKTGESLDYHIDTIWTPFTNLSETNGNDTTHNSKPRHINRKQDRTPTLHRRLTDDVTKHGGETSGNKPTTQQANQQVDPQPELQIFSKDS